MFLIADERERESLVKECDDIERHYGISLINAFKIQQRRSRAPYCDVNF
jgi:hypothetical protein